MSIPSTTIDLVRWIEEIYPNTMELDPNEVGTPAYWKKAGIIELVNMIKIKAGNIQLTKE